MSAALKKNERLKMQDWNVYTYIIVCIFLKY